MKRITIICMAYNEGGTIPLFYREMHPVIERLSSTYEVQLLFMNNASTDDTLDRITDLRSENKNIFVITLSRNVGYQASVDCGLRNAIGDLFVVIDVDCEDPPEMIIDFVGKYEEGYDIVYGERVDREEPASIKFLRKVFYRLLRQVSDDDIVLDMAEFALFTAEVRNAMIELNTSFPFVRGSIGRAGYRRHGVPFKRRSRIAGKTHYNFGAMIFFAVAGILASSTLMLRLPLVLFFPWLLALLGVGIAYIVTTRLWLVVAFAVLFATYVGLCLAFIALYLGRVYKNGLMRPNGHIHSRYSVLQSAIVPARSQSSSR